MAATQHPERLVADYLRRLDSAAAALPARRRAELLAEIRAHIDDALREAGATDEVSVRNVLERLGPPEEIAGAAVDSPATVGASDRSNRIGGLEIAALLVLAVGGVLPIVGWLVGVVLALASDAWSSRDKVVGLAIGLLPVLAVTAILAVGPGGSATLGPLEFAILGWGFLAGLPSALYLGWRLRQTPRLAF